MRAFDMTDESVSSEELQKVVGAFVPAECDADACQDPFCPYVHFDSYGDYTRTAYLLARELLSRREADVWQDISTASKKPHRFIVIAQQRDGGDWIICEAHYVKKGRKGAWYAPGDYGDDEFSQPYEPTHWRPLPQPPLSTNEPKP
jgi:hypothetical protein